VGGGRCAYLAAHGSALSRPASTAGPPATMRRLVGAYAAARAGGRRCGLACATRRAETVALGTHAVRNAPARTHLALFFLAFPDYRVSSTGWRWGRSAVCMGSGAHDLRGSIAGVPPLGRCRVAGVVRVHLRRRARVRGERFFARPGYAVWHPACRSRRCAAVALRV
jgi:hypothetical protein